MSPPRTSKLGAMRSSSLTKGASAPTAPPELDADPAAAPPAPWAEDVENRRAGEARARLVLRRTEAGPRACATQRVQPRASIVG